MLKLNNFEHFVKNPLIKVFIDKKVELRKTLLFILK